MKIINLLYALVLFGYMPAQKAGVLTIPGQPSVILDKPSASTLALFELIKKRRTAEDPAFIAKVQTLLNAGADATWIDEEEMANILHLLFKSAKYILRSFSMNGRSFGHEPFLHKEACAFPFTTTLKILLKAGANATYRYEYSVYQGPHQLRKWATYNAFIDDMDFFSAVWPDAANILAPYHCNPFMTMAMVLFATTGFGLVH